MVPAILIKKQNKGKIKRNTFEKKQIKDTQIKGKNRKAIDGM